jgi:hypothetical protein
MRHKILFRDITPSSQISASVFQMKVLVYTSQQIYILERSEIDHSSRIRHNDYTWFVKDTKSDWCQYELFENLKVWFIDEIEYFLEKTGLKLISKCSDYDLTRLNLEKDFNVVFVTRGS